MSHHAASLERGILRVIGTLLGALLGFLITAFFYQ